MLADGNSLLDEVVEVLTKIRGSSQSLHNPEDLAASYKSDLGNTM